MRGGANSIRRMRGLAGVSLLGLLFLAAPVQAAIRVSVEGLDGELLANVQALLSLKAPDLDPGLSEVRLRQLFVRGRREIARALEPFGYYRPVIDADMARDGNDWRIRYRVDPGEPVRIERLRIQILGEGAEDPKLGAPVDKPGLAEGDVADHRRYEALKRRLMNRALDLGYLEARWQTSELRVDAAAGRAEVVLVLETGPRFLFGPVRFPDDVPLDRAMLQRYVPFRAGEPFSNRGLLALTRALEDSDYFASVEVHAEPERAINRAVPVRVELVPRKRHKYTAGIGFGTDTGARLRLGWAHRRINRAGHRMEAGLRLSQIGHEASLAYSIPLKNPRTDRAVIDAATRRKETDTSTSRIRRLGLNRTRVLGDWLQTLAVEYHDEDFEVGGEADSSRLLLPQAGWSRVRAAKRIDPRRGERVDLSVRGSWASLLSDVSFLQLRASGKWVRSLGERTRLLTRLDAGTTWANDFAALPASLRFFAGGDQSVRGFGLSTLGPTDSDGQVVGGRHLLVGSLELERQVRGPWRAALFVDGGNAFDGLRDDLALGAGVGLRWVSPVGPLRVDLAVAVSEPERPLRLHITLGPDL